MKLKIKVLRTGNISMPKVIKKGDWVDLQSAEQVTMNAPQAGTLKKHTVNGETESHRDVSFDFKLISLGVAMELPKGFEAIMKPRSSTYKNFGIIQSNHAATIDNDYRGSNDIWKFPAIAFKDTEIYIGDRICQFRIQLSQNATVWQKLKWLLSSGIKFVEVNHLYHENRGGIGSTGKR